MITYIEPAGPDRCPSNPDRPVVVEVTEAEAIALSRASWVAHRPDEEDPRSDEEALQDFMVCHWAAYSPDPGDAPAQKPVPPTAKPMSQPTGLDRQRASAGRLSAVIALHVVVGVTALAVLVFALLTILELI